MREREGICNMKKQLITLLIAAAITLSACTYGKPADALPDSNQVGAPFSGSACWDWDIDRLEKEMGSCAESYVSIYGGTTYTYPQSCFGRDGTVKFMFSEDGRLASVAWAFITDSSDDLNTVYEEAELNETKNNGEDSSLTEGVGSSGKVWYTKDTDILISTVAVGGSYGLQYSYISRDFSKRDIAGSR